jgi:hypothetical protein
MVNILSILVLEADSSVGHDTLTLRATNFGAKIRLGADGKRKTKGE